MFLGEITSFFTRVSGRCFVDKPFLCIAAPGNKAKMKDCKESPLAEFLGMGAGWNVAESYIEASGASELFPFNIKKTMGRVR